MHAHTHTRTLFPSLGDTKPLRLLNPTTFLHIHTAEGEMPCSRFAAGLLGVDDRVMGVIMVELS